MSICLCIIFSCFIISIAELISYEKETISLEKFKYLIFIFSPKICSDLCSRVLDQASLSVCVHTSVDHKVLP